MLAVGATGVIVWKLVHPKNDHSPLEDDLLYWFDFAEVNFNITVNELPVEGAESNFSVNCPATYQYVTLVFDYSRQLFIVHVVGGTYSTFYCRVMCKQMGQLNALAEKFNDSLTRSKKH